MRKWMRDRLKRRKKESDDGSVQPTPAPLQPAFYDVQPVAVSGELHAETPEESPEPVEANGAGEELPTVPGQTSANEGDARRRRRRRGRGGSGRTRAAGQVAGQPSTAEAPGELDAPAAGTAPQPLARDKQPAQASAATSVAEVAARPPKGTVVLAIGLPGSGKSSWFKRNNISPLSSDLLRAILFDDPTEQRFQDLVFSNLRSMLKARLIARRPMNYVDTTNLTAHDRHGWIKLAKDYGYEVQAVFFDVPLEVCLERNQKRKRVVPDDVMHRMAGKMKPPTFEEGFSKITVVRVKSKDAATS